METVILKAFHHRNIECIGIFSRQNAALNYIFQKKAGARWSRTNTCWYVPCSRENYQLLVKILSGEVILEIKELEKYLFGKEKK